MSHKPTKLHKPTKKVATKVLFSLLVILIAVMIIFPVYWMFVTSVLPPKEIFARPPRLIPTTFDWSAYSQALHRGDIIRWVLHSFTVAAGVVLFNLFLAVPAAYSMARFKIKFNSALTFLVLATQLVPAALLVVPLFEIFRVGHLINNYISLILADSVITLPMSTWILMGFFEGVPREIEEAGLVDGCNRYSVFFRVALPLVRPALVTVAILTFYDAWNEYLFAATFITKQELWLGTVGLGSFMGQFYVDWRAMMSHSLLFAILPISIYLVFRRFIVRGIAEGFAK